MEGLYCDSIETIESKEGLTWIYIESNHIKDTVFWTWEQLYKCVVN